MIHTRMPSVFVSHGAPTLALEQSPAGLFLDGLAQNLPAQPRAIVVASAHFNARDPLVTSTPQPRTIHDFGGFPAELYNLQYPARGDVQLAGEIVQHLRQAGFDAAADADHGIDHGVWVPLLRAWPQASVPVVALSVSPRADARWHYHVGEVLAPLRAEGVLVLGSGGFVHNLRMLDPAAQDAAPWAAQFADWLRDKVMSGDAAAALEWHTVAPNARQAHPTPEHLYPLYVAWGASNGAMGRLLHQSWQFGSLALDAFAFD